MKNRTDHGTGSHKKETGGKRALLFSLLKTGRDIAGSVLFWCTAVSIAVSACHIAGDAAAFFAGNGRAAKPAASALTETREEEPENSAPAQVKEEGSSVSALAQVMKEGSADPVLAQNLAAESVSGNGQKPGETEPADPMKKTVALTFDDGPHPAYTKKLLDGLLERGVKATFFVIGENIPGNEDLIARMEKEGHLIGNHTYNHVKICDMKKEDACYQVEKTSALVREITGHDTEFVRPPFGAWDPNLECSFVMIPVLWDVDPLDWTTSNTSLVVQRVVEDVDDQDIILLHDFYESSVDAALQIVDILKKEGFEFVTADKLILP